MRLAYFFLPQYEKHVSQAIRLLSKTVCIFAGASNSNYGLISSLERLNSINLINNGSIAQIGPGNRWYEVFRELEKSNVTVLRGRTGSVGAILANGYVVDVNVTSYPDLYWALRGGGGNFAIITRFDMYSFPHEMMWGGIRSYTID
ncbi:hypothetical protein N7507_003551 [Penicillium longicatenatum]|nr:hypothetical protein N7507_003551 [Penicillium longicatenatum]